jgi:hypothetical protein
VSGGVTRRPPALFADDLVMRLDEMLGGCGGPCIILTQAQGTPDCKGRYRPGRLPLAAVPVGCGVWQGDSRSGNRRLQLRGRRRRLPEAACSFDRRLPRDLRHNDRSMPAFAQCGRLLAGCRDARESCIPIANAAPTTNPPTAEVSGDVLRRGRAGSGHNEQRVLNRLNMQYSQKFECVPRRHRRRGQLPVCNMKGPEKLRRLSSDGEKMLRSRVSLSAGLRNSG